ncbi:MAG: recombinase family protein [Proteobacteria bacterium]|nr:recombinase family protein [Pseudomonadota bacterium]
MTLRAAIYARYSSDLQSHASIEDQVRLCRRLIKERGWSEALIYSDAAMSGASTLRPGYQKMLEDAHAGTFDVLVAEAMDRMSRDQEDIAGLYKRLTFADIKLVTLSEGEINELHVGLKGTMNALFLKDLAAKTRRGLEGRVKQGKSGGGNAFGYDVIRTLDANGELARGERSINQDEAKVVRRIYIEFANGRSPRSIAHGLNNEGVTGPRNGSWGPSTIYGNWRRGTGILNNDLYVGLLVWNRQRFVKDPQTGRRQARINPETEWIIQDVPSLRIVDDELWQRVKDRQQNTRRQIAEGRDIRSERARRPRYLLSGLLQCGVCGGGFSKISQKHYGCSTARNKGTCNNLLTIRRNVIEEMVLAGLKDQLMQPEAYEEFIAEFNREANRLASSEDQEREHLGRDIEKVDGQIARLIEAIKSGVPGEAVKDEITALEAHKTALTSKLEIVPLPKPRLHPNLARIYRDKIENLIAALNSTDMVSEAAEAIRSLITAVRLVPVQDQLEIELYGELAALLSLGLANKHKHPRSNDPGVQVTLVAGVGFVEERTICRSV